ncbi:MAG: hypothetical protein RSD83_00800, partial [Hafnia sp.]|uniref:hypothetical protein n=1 Tax=Hafnia sp. TaxID=1873498 RepID=UPI002FCAD903
FSFLFFSFSATFGKVALFLQDHLAPWRLYVFSLLNPRIIKSPLLFSKHNASVMTVFTKVLFSYLCIRFLLAWNIYPL